MTIGKKIRELRLQNGLTQEKLAEFLCVSSQAISKWENNVTCPDLLLIKPLTKIFHVTSDELLGLNEDESDKIRAEFDRAYQNRRKESDNVKNYVAAREAVIEYPGDFRYLDWLAEAEYCLAYEENLKPDSSVDFFDEMTENALRRYEFIIENCGDEKIKKNAVLGKITVLRFLERTTEADWSAEFEYPDTNINTSEAALKLCPDGIKLLEYLEKEKSAEFK